jgi:beta-lactamase regulating signal transducer with metallopeptidase domain
MAYSVLFGAMTYAAALAADRVAATWGRCQRFVWLAAVIVAVTVPAMLATRPRIEPAVVGVAQATQEIDVPIASTHITSTAPTPKSLRSVAAREIGAADPIVIRVWLIASLVCVAMLLRAAIGVRRRRAHWHTVEIDGTTVLVSPNVGPAVIGALAPRVVIPQWALSLNPPARALMLRHEREHIRARDPLLLLGAVLVTTLAPWNVALWVLVRRLRLAIEIDCDQRVLRASAQRREYGELLLTVGARKGAPLPFATSLAERRPFLERRIRAMTMSNPRHPRLLSAVCVLLIAAASTAAVRAPHPNSLITHQVPAPKPSAPVIASPAIASPIAEAAATAIESLPTPTSALPVLETPESKPIDVVEPTPKALPTIHRGPDSLTVDDIRKLIAAHHPSALNGDPDINTITLVLDAHDNYVTSLAESRPFAVGAGGGRGGAGGFVTGGVIYARGGAMPEADSLKVLQGAVDEAIRSGVPVENLRTMEKRLKDLADALKAKLAETQADTTEIAARRKVEMAAAKMQMERTSTIGSVMGLNMTALSQVIDPESMQSTLRREFEPGQLGTTALRVFIVRLKP